MFELIEKLRKKSDRTKKQVAFLTAFTFASLIFGVWVTIVFPDWRYAQNQEAKADKATPSPTSAISGTFSEGISAIQSQLAQLRQAVDSYSPEPEHYTASSTSDASGNGAGQ